MRMLDTPSRRSVLGGMSALLATTTASCASLKEQKLAEQAETKLQRLVGGNEAAARLNAEAKAVLVFPKITKGGLIVGGLHGKGVLLRGGEPAGYYELTAVSYGLQAGAQTYASALFFMTDAALAYLDRSGGWSLGSGPSLVVADAGMARTMTTTTVRKDVYAFIYGQQGLMAGLGLEGAKISRIR
ncbi:lipid-binding SYLF domain-containing protein [Caulobacter sp. 17J65-9]|uniref:lipid-binding SYLF domain-containing protein n=1 Tax=Caulobacter sp. 17J65-9 TaxID=2709382 RepID=UPI0013C8E00C|nr:lipid-binding SYLF domain-containing protein [Caulobacter sp. 17J65-9]NEX93714.1 lipid-binding SYLF domain-containing protein [Caulobacter sp. 17J65-9]